MKWTWSCPRCQKSADVVYEVGDGVQTVKRELANLASLVMPEHHRQSPTCTATFDDIGIDHAK
jgi:hypothetical protein